MIFRHWFRKLSAQSQSAAAYRTKAHRSCRAYPHAERLEDRCVPSLLTVGTFNGLDGANPYAGLIEDTNGNLFGTTTAGGLYGYGTVFEILRSSDTITTLASFDGLNGMNPECTLVEDSSGNLFGTTNEGGASYNFPVTNGIGTVFELQKGSSTVTTLASFDGSNGAAPHAGLVEDSSGNLFGTTSSGGAGTYGTVFELQKGSSMVTTLIAFTGPNGLYPYGGLIEDSNGNLFGTTESGGSSYASPTNGGSGSVFEFSTVSGVLTTLASFNGNNGSEPQGRLVEDGSGNLFGTTLFGGASGQGSVFEVQTGSGTITTISSFDNVHNANGSAPEPDLIEDASGDLFGITGAGGPFSGSGTVFEVPGGTNIITTLAAFPAYNRGNGTSGAYPNGGLLEDGNGDIFGTTNGGGAYGWGTVFEVHNAVPALTITTPSLTNWFPNEPGYSQTLSAIGGTVPYTFAVSSGSLPPGLMLNQSGGITGTPSVSGDYSLTVTATDTSGLTGSQNYSINIAPGPLSQYIVSAPTTTAAQSGNPFLVTVQAADQFGNPVSNYSGPATVIVIISRSSSESGFPTAVSINSSGLGYFLADLQKTGTYTITVASGSLSGTSTPVTVTPGAPTALAFAAQPVNTPTGDTLATVNVEVVDAYGNVETSDNTDSITLSVASGPGSFTALSTRTATVSNGLASFSNLMLVVPGTYKLSAVLPEHFIVSSAAFQVLPLQVMPASFGGSDQGFSLQFNAPFLVNSLTPVLYGQGYGAAAPAPSVIVTTDPDNLSDTASYVEGSLVVNPTTNSITFVSTDTAYEANSQFNNTVSGTPVSPLLPDGTYTVIVRGSAAGDGFQAVNSGGGFLDGLGSGTPGSGDFTTTFTVNAAAAHDDVLWVPATADGPGQALEAPGMNRAGGGYPVYLNDNTGTVTSVQVTLNYNPALLMVTGVSGPGFSLLGTSTPGHADLQYSGPPLATRSETPIGYFLAMVPGGTASSPTPYKAKDLLHLSNVSLNGGSIPVATSDALHLVAYVGDADGNGAYSSNDAVLITRAAIQSDSGFAAYPLVDPVIVADTDGSGFIPADAGLQANEAGVGFPTASLPSPPIPAGVHFRAIGNNVDPSLSVGVRGEGSGVSSTGIVTTEVNLDDAHPAGSSGLIRANLALSYDPRQFTVSAADVHLGSLLAAAGGWSMVPTIDQADGVIGIALSSDTPIARSEGGSLVIIDFHQIAGDGEAETFGRLGWHGQETMPQRVENTSYINLVQSADVDGQVVSTELEDAQGTFTLTPVPIDGFDRRIDGVVSLSAVPSLAGNVAPQTPAEATVVSAVPLEIPSSEVQVSGEPPRTGIVHEPDAPAKDVSPFAGASGLCGNSPSLMAWSLALPPSEPLVLLDLLPDPACPVGQSRPVFAAGQRAADLFFQALALETVAPPDAFSDGLNWDNLVPGLPADVPS